MPNLSTLASKEFLLPLAGVLGVYLVTLIILHVIEKHFAAPKIVIKGIKLLFWILATLLVLSNLGYDVSSLLAGLGIGGVAVALGAQETLSNLFGSIAILTDKPFKVGERIKIDNHEGKVLKIGMRSTKIQTDHQTVIVIPNKVMASAAIENLSHS